MGVITISRQLGSGGTDVARLVADKLGYQLVDRKLVDLVAARLGIRPQDAYGLDERSLAGLSGFVDSLVRSMADHPVTVESYRYTAARVLREVAAADDAVIVGRAGQVILARQPNAFHVFIGAPKEVRIQRVQEDRRILKPEAKRLVEDSDENRRGYVWQVGHVNVTDTDLYDLVISTRRLSIENAAELVVFAAQHYDIARLPGTA